MALPQTPVGQQDFISYIAKHPDISIHDLVRPFNERESKLRELFAQAPDNETIEDPHVNVVPVYAGYEEELKIRGRNPDNDNDNEKYIMPVKKDARLPDGSSAVVETLNEFKKNFNLFSESSLADLDWNNVVAAGSAVVTSLLPVSEEHKESTRALRTYYHDKIAPSSDVDLFLWGLTEEQAIQKVGEIERSVKNSILADTTTIRTKFAVTIVSQYPTRHVQIVLRLYKSVSEILTGFDVDSSCFAYDGSQVYGTPRGVAAFITRCNVVDLSRRSPSYENRLAKYAARGFEIFCPDLDRERVDATIFDRSFGRVQGLARLLVLERLPQESDREKYRDRRRHERARPPFEGNGHRHTKRLRDNFKDKDPQDVAEWMMQEQDDLSNYHSFTIPYGPRFNAKKIEKLVYTKDLLLNAEWNSKKNRTVNLHRHPCFVGDFDSVIADCCTTCPKPITQEEREVAEEENKKYVSGGIEFITDDPGRQTIGSFHPLTKADWTQQAYLGDLEPLCQAIVDNNQEFVQNWCKSINVGEDHRDHTGRTPLHLACLIGKTGIVQILVDAGARLISRLADGLTPLHIACIRGDTDIINILLEKSEANEAFEAETAEIKHEKHEEQSVMEDDPDSMEIKESQSSDHQQDGSEAADSGTDHDSIEVVDDVDDIDEDGDTMSMTQGSFVKVKPQNGGEEVAMDKESEGPDVYDINLLAWDNPVSPLHLAIIFGHTEAVHLLVSKFGADVLLPVKVSDYRTNVIMTLTLAARNTERSEELTKLLLELGASPSQSDSEHVSALQSVALVENIEALKAMLQQDPARSQRALKHIGVKPNSWNTGTCTALTAVIDEKAEATARELLKAGAPPYIGYDEWARAYLRAATSHTSCDKSTIRERFGEVEQPVIRAASSDLPGIVEQLLDMGVDMNQLDPQGFKMVNKSGAQYLHLPGRTLLDVVVDQMELLSTQLQTTAEMDSPVLSSQDQYTQSYTKDSYQYWQIRNQYKLAEGLLKNWEKLRNGLKEILSNPEDIEPADESDDHDAEQKQRKRDHFERVRAMLLANGARTFAELHPGVTSVHAPVMDKAEKKKEAEELSLEIDFEIPSEHFESQNDYVQLFEAAWHGDKEKIRSLTCKPDQQGNVLRIAVRDNMGTTPLHIAIWRGEYDTAELMLEIADQQYTPDEKDRPVKRRYNIRDSSLDDNSNASDEVEDDISMSSELVDQDSTTGDIAKLAQQMGSKSQAIDLLSWQGQFWMFDDQSQPRYGMKSQKFSRQERSILLNRWHQTQASAAFFRTQMQEVSSSNKFDILEYAIETGNDDLTDRIIKWIEKYSNPITKSKQLHVTSPRIVPGDRKYVFQALRLGYVAIANRLVAQFGAGIPIESFIEEAGMPDPEATQYYQGLFVRGKRRKDWSKKANNTAHTGTSQDTLNTSLLLDAVASEGIAAVEWCLSEAPQSLLSEYMSHSKDQRIKDLIAANNGPDGIVEEWLGTRRVIVLHMAILSNKWESDEPEEKAQAAELLRYLIQAMPQSLETKNATGYTPLALAFWTRRAQAAAILMEAGASQTVRDYNGANIYHLAVNKIGKWSKQDVRDLDECLALVDKDILLSLSTERCSFGPTGMTPLATWLWRLPIHLNGPSTVIQDEIEASILEVLLKYMDEEALRMVDGSGQMPLHLCMRRNSIGLLDLLCTRYPGLIAMENGMGQTPIELCCSMFTQEAASRHNTSAAVTYIPGGMWDSRQRRPLREPAAHYKTLTILAEMNLKYGVEKSRVLISALLSAEVSKRLADAEITMRKLVQHPYEYGRTESPKHKDEVEKWLRNNNYGTEEIEYWRNVA